MSDTLRAHVLQCGASGASEGGGQFESGPTHPLTVISARTCGPFTTGYPCTEGECFPAGFPTGGVASPFDVLGIDSDADDEEIRRAYRRRVKAAHPDHGGSTAEFQRIRGAYEALRNGQRPSEVAVPADPVEDTVDGADEREPADPEPTGSTVEYLNYEVLADHGWSLDDDDLFEKAREADLDAEAYGEFSVRDRETLLEAAENDGLAWPYACRGGACANCAVAVIEGEMKPAADGILGSELTREGIRLSCLSGPATDEMQVVYNVKHLPGLEDLWLPADRFRRANPSDD